MTYGAVAYATGPYASPAGAAPTIVAGTGPVWSVEIAFASDPLDETPRWVQVPHRTGMTSSGRQSEIGRFSSAQCTVTIGAADRTYDNNNTASAYYGQMRPGKQLRVQATWAGVTYPVFTGYINSWNMERTNPRDAVAVVTASDAFKLLTRGDLGTGAYAAEVQADDPAHWYRLDEPTGATTLFDSAGARHLVAQGTLVQTASLLARDDDPATAVDAVTDGGISPLTVQAADVTAFCADIVYSTLAAGAGQTIAAEVDDIVSRGWSLGVDTGIVEVFILTSAGTAALQSVATVDDGIPHHLAVRWNGGTAWLYVDGVEVATASAPGTLFTAGTYSYVIMGGAAAGPIVNSGSAGTYDELAIYYSDLGATRIAAHAAQVATPWDNDTPAQRVNRVLNIIEFPTVLRELDTGSSVLQSATLGESALEHAQKVADSEFGELFINSAGAVRLVGRAGLINRPSLATFSDNGVDLRYFDLRGKFDDAELANVVTISRLDGVAQTWRDTTSIDDNGPAYLTRSGLLHDSDALSLAGAQFLVSTHKDPLDRFTGLTIKPWRDPTTLAPQALGRQLLEVITVQQTPQHVGSADSRAVRIEGISHTWEPGRTWETTWDLSPALTAAYAVWDGSTSLWDTARWFF